MHKILTIIIFTLLLINTASANANNCELVQINSTHWYFVTTQTDLVWGTYSYQAFANNISSDYRELEYFIPPPQNVSTISHQTSVDIDWYDTSDADKYSVYEMEDGFSYVDTNPTMDGIKDAIYDYAHEFLIFAPNPVNTCDYETIYPLRTSLGAYFLIESVDNDDKTGDDDTIYYFDLDNDGLTVDDPAWKITDNIVKKYEWDGTSWKVTGVSNAVGESTGSGTHYPIHELFIPVAELGGNWTNGSTVKVLVKREDSSLTPDVITWYPFGNINDSDTALWQEMVLNQPNTYTWLANVTLSNYTALNLTPFTIYHGAISSWNGTTESDYTLFDVITEDLHRYNASGYILDGDGNGIANATVYSCNGFVHEITTTNESGYWIGYKFCEQTYIVCANKIGYHDNSIEIYVDSNLTNQNITLTVFSNAELYEKLLEIEELLTIEETAPTEIIKMTYQIFLMLIIIDILLIWYSFTHIDVSNYTDIITSLLAMILSILIAYNSIIGVSYFFATQSTVHEIIYTSVSLMVMFITLALVMLIFFITKILEITHSELDEI